jgi:hypothetical protein
VQVQGLAAINAANGWAIALAGACIVMTGLASLAFIISQLHKVVALIDKKVKPDEPVSEETAAIDQEVGNTDVLSDLAATAKLYRSLSTGLGETFELTKLYQILVKENLPHPHITIRALREAGYLAPAGEGSFSWKNV